MSAISREQVLEQCALALLGDQPLVQQPEPVQSLLKALNYERAPDGSVGTDDRHRAKLLRAAAGFARLFQLRSPDAPGLVFFGAEIDPGDIHPGGLGQRALSASGVGLSFRAAFEGCVGEGIELLSQFECDHDVLLRATQAQAAADHDTAMTESLPLLLQQSEQPPDTEVDWIVARRLPDDKETLFPADICLRRGSRQLLVPLWPLSIGCAAGISFEAAALHGLLELIERDAAALWWRGGMRGHAIALDDEATHRVLNLLMPIRGSVRRRQTWLLDITTDLGIPSVASVSVAPDGHGFACGLASRLSLAMAAEAAVLEMCQMELAHEVVATKRRERGDKALNTYDLAHLRRSTELNPEDCLLLGPLPPRTVSKPGFDVGEAPTALSGLVRHLAASGVETFVIDLTRPRFGVPVVRMLCPALEKEPSQMVGDRLRAAIARSGGGDADTRGIPLM